MIPLTFKKTSLSRKSPEIDGIKNVAMIRSRKSVLIALFVNKEHMPKFALIFYPNGCAKMMLKTAELCQL